MYSFTSNLNSTFWRKADKMTSSTETQGFALAWWINANILCGAAKLVYEILKFFAQDKCFSLIVNQNVLLLKFLPSFFHLVAFVWEC